MSQCSQPCVCAIIDTELPVPPTGKAALLERRDERPHSIAADDTMNSMFGADREAHVAFRVLVGEVAQLADRARRPSAAASRRAPSKLRRRCARRGAARRARAVVVLPVAVVLRERRVQELLVVGDAAIRSPGAFAVEPCIELLRRPSSRR